MKKISIRYEGCIVDAVLLGIYTREFYKVKKRLINWLFIKNKNNKIVKDNIKTYLVYIPWKHRMKQLAEITESNVLPFDKTFPSEWISKPQYTSIGTEEYHPTMPITDFWGYPFIIQHNSFIADQISGEYEANLAILYSEMPELVNEEFDEEIL